METVNFEHKGKIAYITMNRPENRQSTSSVQLVVSTFYVPPLPNGT